MDKSDFVHLHVHSDFSLLDGAAKVASLAKAAKERGQKALALTDHGTLSGLVAFHKACTKEGVKPILGCEGYIAPGDDPEAHKRRQERTAEERAEGAHGRDYTHVTLLAKNDVGWKNLTKLASIASLEGFYYKPRMSWHLLQKHHEGLIVLSGCLKGQVAEWLQLDRYDEARRVAARWKDLMGDDYYLEVQPNSLPEQAVVNDGSVRLAKELGIKLVAACDLHYVDPEDAELQEVKICVSSRKTLGDNKHLKMSPEFYFRSSEDVQRHFGDWPEAILSTREIADKVGNIDLLPGTKGRYFLPKFKTPDGSTSVEYFRRLCGDGLVRRYGAQAERHRARLEFEVGVIERMGFVDYFLITADFIDWARRNGCPVGPGRGSAAGAIVSYCLGITGLDPVRYGLLFERFLNPDRVSMPDIDIDFCERNRWRVIDYVKKKYGEEAVCQIATFAILKPKSAIKDVARVLEVPFSEANMISELVPGGPEIKTIEDAIKVSPELERLREDPRYKKLFDLALQLEGLNRSAGRHAAGIVIADTELTNRIPLMKIGKEEEAGVCTQFTMTEVEDCGLLKMDFLGLRTMTVIYDALALIEQTTGKRIAEEAIPLRDAGNVAATSGDARCPVHETPFSKCRCCDRALELYRRAAVNGVFQVESDGMRKLIADMKADRYEDLVAAVALYRPGPLGSKMDQSYVKRKVGEEPISYDHPSLEPFLRETQGLYIYQEQVMQLSSALAGFSLAEADKLRKAIGKKKLDEMEKLKGKFIDGCQKVAKLEVQKAVAIWESIVKFADYCMTGDTEILDATTGKVHTVAELARSGWDGVRVHALDESNKIRERKILSVWSTGVRDVYETRTRTNKRVRTTADHPFKTTEGWVEAKDLKPKQKLLTVRLLWAFDKTRSQNKDAPADDVFVDEVVSVTPCGSEETFDIEVETDHNFAVNGGIIVHNCFNKSHSAAYALISWRTAWLKANYPVEFMAAVLTSECGDTDKLMPYVEECRTSGIPLDPPDVLESDVGFSVVKRDGVKRIVYGLLAVKGIGPATVEHVVATRKKVGRFRSFLHFCESVDHKLCGKSHVETLVKAGAFRSLGKRSQLLPAVERTMAAAAETRRVIASGQNLLFGGASGNVLADARLDDSLVDQKAAELPLEEVLALEKETLGFYLTAHPLDGYHEAIEQNVSVGCGKLAEAADPVATIGGMVVSLRIIPDRNQNEMAFFTLQDTTGSCDCVAFSRSWIDRERPDSSLKYVIRPEAKVLLRGRIDKTRTPPSFQASAGCTITKEMARDAVDKARGIRRQRVEAAEEAREAADAPANAFTAAKAKRLVVTFVVEDTREEHITALRALLDSKPRGPDHVYWAFVRREDGAKDGPHQVGGTNSSYGVHLTDELCDEVAETVPGATVSVQIV